MDSDEEPNKYKFDLPSFIIKVMLWTARFLVYIKLFNSGEPILNTVLMIALYSIMEIGISILLSFIRYLPPMLKNPGDFINMSRDQIKELINNDVDFINIHNGIITIVYLFLYFS